MTSLTKNPHLPSKKIFFRVQTRRLAVSFETFTGSVKAYRTGEIPAQSHLRLGVFFENPGILVDTKELKTAKDNLSSCLVVFQQ